MSFIIYKIIIYSAVMQSFLDMISGHTIEVKTFIFYWQPVQIIMNIVDYLWLLFYVFDRNSHFYKRDKLNKKWYFVFFISILSIVSGVQKGFGKQYIGYWGDTETLFWIFNFIIIGRTINTNEARFYALLQSLKKIIIIFAVLGIFLGIQKIFFPSSFSGRIHYNESFLISFYFFIFSNDVIIYGSRSKTDIIGFYSIILFLLINFNKSIILLSVCSVIMILYFSLSRKTLKYRKKQSFYKKLLIPLLIFMTLSVLIVDAFEIKPIRRFAEYQWSERILHKSQGDISAGRFELWKTTIKNVKENPYRGMGIGFRIDERNGSGGNKELIPNKKGVHVHNHWLYFIGAIGLPGGLFLIIAYIIYLVTTARIIRSRFKESDYPAFYIPWWCFSFSMGIFALYGLWNISPVGYILYGFSIGYNMKLTITSSGKRQCFNQINENGKLRAGVYPFIRSYRFEQD
jgi:hypothetical protein